MRKSFPLVLVIVVLLTFGVEKSQAENTNATSADGNALITETVTLPNGNYYVEKRYSNGTVLGREYYFTFAQVSNVSQSIGVARVNSPSALYRPDDLDSLDLPDPVLLLLCWIGATAMLIKIHKSLPRLPQPAHRFPFESG